MVSREVHIYFAQPSLSMLVTFVINIKLITHTLSKHILVWFS
jgi:hypothetical protein